MDATNECGRNDMLLRKTCTPTAVGTYLFEGAAISSDYTAHALVKTVMNLRVP
jgi:hypothetical protein